MGFDMDDTDGGGLSGSVFIRSSLVVGARTGLCDMAVFERHRVTGDGGARFGILADCDRTSGVGECSGGEQSTSDRKDTDLRRLGGGGVGAWLLHEATLSDLLNSGVGEFKEVGERIDDIAVSDRIEICFSSALLGQAGTGVAVLLRGIGFITDELVVAVSTGYSCLLLLLLPRSSYSGSVGAPF